MVENCLSDEFDRQLWRVRGTSRSLAGGPFKSLPLYDRTNVCAPSQRHRDEWADRLTPAHRKRRDEQGTTTNFLVGISAALDWATCRQQSSSMSRPASSVSISINATAGISVNPAAIEQNSRCSPSFREKGYGPAILVISTGGNAMSSTNARKMRSTRSLAEIPSQLWKIGVREIGPTSPIGTRHIRRLPAAASSQR